MKHDRVHDLNAGTQSIVLVFDAAAVDVFLVALKGDQRTRNALGVAGDHDVHGGGNHVVILI